MVFSSIAFIFWFLPGVLLAHTLAPKRFRNLVLLIASLFFYIWGGGALVVILIVSVAVDFVLGRVVDRARQAGDARRVRMGVAGSVVANLGLLGYFKYAGFLVAQFNHLGDSLGLGTVAWHGPILPIGISFFTFQSMSYTIDIARGRTRHLPNLVDFAVYVTLFPQLIAGPIVRFHEIATEVQHRSLSFERAANGAARFCHGLVKKVIIADTLGTIVDPIFSATDISTGVAWLGAIAYTLQIYFDFSGYSDMAIGIGGMLGFTFPENFKRPYSALSVTDFWRRWHITLSNWLRDYLYFPLGGSRVGPSRMYLNLVLVFFLTGFWHGAGWTFVVWGIYHGSIMLIERAWGRRWIEASPHPAISRARTLLLVVFGWVVFRAPDLSSAVDYLRVMVTPRGGVMSSAVRVAVDTRSIIALMLGSLVFLLSRDHSVGRAIELGRRRWSTAYAVGVVAVGLPLSAFAIAAGSFSPFLYFQF